MQYPTMSATEASMQLAARRAGLPSDPEPGVKLRGSGPEMEQAYVARLREELETLRAAWPDGLRNDKERNIFEAKAARITHSIIPYDAEILCDADYWIWLAVVCFPDLVEWRYGNPEGGTQTKNYGVGGKIENLMWRLWMRAELVLDDEHSDRYHLVDSGQIDFYRSHLFRQRFANARGFARAFLKFQYPREAPTTPTLKLPQVRELAKRVCRAKSNLFLEILPEDECLAVIKAEAEFILAVE